MVCGCPDGVIFTLRRTVQTELNKVRALLRLSRFFDSAVSGVIGEVDADVTSAVNAIPDPISIGFLDLVDYLTCPLLPLALGLDLADFEDLDPTDQLNRVRSLKAGELNEARKGYENAIKEAETFRLIKIARNYTGELLRQRLTADSFTNAVIVSATVLAVCGAEEYNAGPYAEFANLTAEFTFENNVPSLLSQNSQAIVQKLLNAETKFEALRGSLT